jgi:hypothetical protein
MGVSLERTMTEIKDAPFRTRCSRISVRERRRVLK